MEAAFGDQPGQGFSRERKAAKRMGVKYLVLQDKENILQDAFQVSGTVVAADSLHGATVRIVGKAPRITLPVAVGIRPRPAAASRGHRGAVGPLYNALGSRLRGNPSACQELFRLPPGR